MKAAVCYEFGQPLVVESVAIDEPRANEVKIKLSACAICHSDVLFIDGAWNGTLPAIYGHEGAGTVSDCGANADDFQPGDRVIVSLLRSCGHCYFCKKGQFNLCENDFCTDHAGRLKSTTHMSVHRGLGTGCFAEYAIVHKSQVVKIPQNISFTSASLLACGVITGYGAVVNSAKIKPLSNVVTVGAGGVGLNSIQAAKIMGAQKIIAVDIDSNRLQAAKKFGATHIANSAIENVQSVVYELTDTRGADYVFVTTGNEHAINQSVSLLRRGGTAVLVGMPSIGVKGKFEAIDFIDANQSLLGCKMGNSHLATDIPKLVDLYQSGTLLLDELVSNTWSLEKINEAVDATRNGTGLKNIVVFD